jgi:hypothetical protein
MASLELDVGGYVPANNRCPIGRILKAVVFENANLNLPLTK